MADLLMEAIHNCRRVIVQTQVSHSTATDNRHPIHQKPIRGTTDTKAEDARRPNFVVDGTHDLLFVADVAVRHEGHQTKSTFVMRKIKCRFDAFDHVSAASTVQGRNILQTPLNIGFSRQHGRRTELRSIVGKPYNLKAVSRSERLQCAGDRGFRLSDRLTSHTARTVQHKDHLHRTPLYLSQVCGRIQHHGKILAVVIFVSQHGRLDLIPCHFVSQHEILVWDSIP